MFFQTIVKEKIRTRMFETCVRNIFYGHSLMQRTLVCGSDRCTTFLGSFQYDGVNVKKRKKKKKEGWMSELQSHENKSHSS